MSFFRSATLRLASIVLMLAVIGAASSRCAFAMMASQGGSKSASSHACCPVKPAQSDHPAPAQPVSECCQKVQMISQDQDGGAKFVKAPQLLLALALIWTSANAPDLEPAHDASTQAAGPPQSVSFAERVLQHSLLSHAPPYAA